LERRFGVEEVQGPDRVWVSDITYVPTREGWLYLATVLDLGTRRVVGWNMGETLEVELATGALGMALAQRRPGRGLLHHSDRGVQYAAHAYREILERHGAVASMSRKGNCWDNAVAEAFYSTLEFELIEGADWQTRAQARRAIFSYIEGWYNRERLHSSLGYLSPVEYERRLALTVRAAQTACPSSRGKPKGAVPVPADVAVHLVGGIEAVACDEALGEAERHGGVVRPLSRLQAERSVADHVGDRGEGAGIPEFDGGAECVADGEADQGAAEVVAGIGGHGRARAFPGRSAGARHRVGVIARRQDRWGQRSTSPMASSGETLP
jgi:hypothetical protein